MRYDDAAQAREREHAAVEYEKSSAWEEAMALIEHLQRDGWEEFLRDIFEYTLDVLKNDRFRSVGSSVDDLRSWLAAGGVARVRELLDNQMAMLGFSPSRQSAVQNCLDQLAREHREALLHLTAEGIVRAPRPGQLGTQGVSIPDIQDFFRRLDAGERPFDDWMYAHGHSDEDIAEIYGAIDSWLMGKGIIAKPGPLPKRT